MRYELTVYDTEAREDRVREYTESRRRAAVWALMPRVRLGGSFHHLVFRVREYSSGPKKPEISLRRIYPEQEKALGDLHQKVREAKALTGPQVQMLEELREAGEEGARFAGAVARRIMDRLKSRGLLAEASWFPEAAISDKGREYLALRILP
jgi:hypothetical protein